jgi:putative membrane protein
MLLRRIATTLGVAGLLIFPATAVQATPIGQAEPAAQSGITASAEPTAQDAAYLRAVYQNNLGEIDSGRIAWQKTADKQVKDMAATFMRDSIHLNADLYQTARTLRVTLPSALTAEQEALSKRYQAAATSGFDDLYISTRMEARQEALDLTQTKLKQGGDPKVKAFAEDAAPVLAGHEKLLQAAAN